ncbi:uncharacterized protein [Clytia hemisphaerica]|uniref:uncharacterized protein isoform X2 n=1 Tax=Clytia hemisphaerica TaxID=252671 RepID=UPI0034D476D4
MNFVTISILMLIAANNIRCDSSVLKGYLKNLADGMKSSTQELSKYNFQLASRSSNFLGRCACLEPVAFPEFNANYDRTQYLRLQTTKTTFAVFKSELSRINNFANLDATTKKIVQSVYYIVYDQINTLSKDIIEKSYQNTKLIRLNKEESKDLDIFKNKFKDALQKQSSSPSCSNTVTRLRQLLHDLRCFYEDLFWVLNKMRSKILEE